MFGKEKSETTENPTNGNVPGELASLTTEEWYEKYARLLADFDNYRKRTREDNERQAQSRKSAFIVDLLQVVDNFERALDAAQGDSSDLAQGMRAIDRQLRDLLAAHDVTPLEAQGQPFDPHLHEAIGLCPDPDLPVGTVSSVAQRGWKRGDTVLRHARVIVVSEPPRPAEESAETE